MPDFVVTKYGPLNRSAFHEGHTDEEKIQWIYRVKNMATINSITKDELRTALEWLFDYVFEETALNLHDEDGAE